MYAIDKQQANDPTTDVVNRSNAGWNTEELLEKIKTKTKLEQPCFWKTQYIQWKLSTLAFAWTPNRDDLLLAYQVRKKLEFSNSIPITILGEGGSGKTSLIYRFVQGVFQTEYDPTIEDLFEKRIDMPNRRLSFDLSIRDTSGQEEWPRASDIYIRESWAFVKVYSLTNKNSLKDVENHITRIKTLKDERIEGLPIVLVGNKSDLYSHREVSREEEKEVAKKFDLPFLETSAKFGTNVDQVFIQLAEEVVFKTLRMTFKKRKKENCTIQ